MDTETPGKDIEERECEDREKAVSGLQAKENRLKRNLLVHGTILQPTEPTEPPGRAKHSFKGHKRSSEETLQGSQINLRRSGNSIIIPIGLITELDRLTLKYSESSNSKPVYSNKASYWEKFKCSFKSLNLCENN